MLKNIRDQFPILKRKINGKRLVYLDSAATSQKPQFVIDSISEYYKKYNANIHRSSHVIAKEATTMWIDSHRKVANFINADSYKEIVFVRNSTEGLNLIANTYGRQNLKGGDIVVLSEMEHHSNIVPWLILQKEIGFDIKYIPVSEEYDLDIGWLKELIKNGGSRVKIISVVHISNVLGTINPVKEIVEIGHSVGAFVMVDGAQSIPHIKVDVRDIGCDAFVFSGHKVYAPTGSGVLYCKESILGELNPFMGGGEMILSVSKDSFEANDIPWRFEAGTPDIESGICLGSALDWFENVVKEMGGWDKLREHDVELLDALFNEFDGIEWFKVFGKSSAKERYGVLAFNIEGFSFKGCKEKVKMDGSSIVEYLSKRGIAVREGFHCAEPLHDRFKVGPTMRVSVGIYNTKEDIQVFAKTLKEAVLSSY
ncbi:MAG: aminotransferase class V-fold PLP-dependent enzyme [Candidatus Dojkabacteria bacterium]|nr:aminotransferase class V-fold PLP-dependent enzyme [Candidatus Dojkabacteria bacterium]